MFEVITYEVKNKSFDPSRWVKGDVRRFLFESQWERWLELKAAQVQRKELSPGYLAQIQSYQKHILAFFRGRDVWNLKKADMTDFWRVLDGKRLSPKTVLNLLRLIRSFLNFLKSKEIIERVSNIPEVELTKPNPRSWIKKNSTSYWNTSKRPFLTIIPSFCS